MKPRQRARLDEFRRTLAWLAHRGPTRLRIVLYSAAAIMILSPIMHILTGDGPGSRLIWVIAFTSWAIWAIFTISHYGKNLRAQREAQNALERADAKALLETLRNINNQRKDKP